MKIKKKLQRKIQVNFMINIDIIDSGVEGRRVTRHGPKA